MARSCSVCAHPKLDEVDRLLADGVSVPAISGTYEIPTSNLYRHRTNHTTSDVVEFIERHQLSSRVADLADDLRRARITAQARGNTSTALRAAAVELRALDALSSRLGIDDSTLVTFMEQVATFTTIVARVAMTNPDLLEALEGHEHTELLARNIRAEIDRQKEIQK